MSTVFLEGKRPGTEGKLPEGRGYPQAGKPEPEGSKLISFAVCPKAKSLQPPPQESDCTANQIDLAGEGGTTDADYKKFRNRKDYG